MKQCAARVVLGIRRTVHGTFARDGLGTRRQWVKRSDQTGIDYKWGFKE
jgi:hypothetical protein